KPKLRAGPDVPIVNDDDHHFYIKTSLPAWLATDGVAVANTPGINVDFTGNAAGVTSFWAAFERSGGATRFMSTGGDTYVYTGGTVEIPGLGIKLSVGADIVPQ
ncbi:hypothetical protein INQ16_31850, partial [Escherichia coli]|nr:hypothetical protein [Escherichia coli]